MWGNEIKLYRRIVYTIHCPATIKAVKDVSPKEHIKGCRLCFAKADGGLLPTVQGLHKA